MMRVRIGRPIDPQRYAGRGGDRMALRQITDEVMYEIRGLSGQEYVDTYATKKSEDIPSAEPVKIGPEPEAGGSGNGSNGRRSSAEVLRAAAS
jgi:1-acyl-sn-glycerol-3-phosphate acyltransferase